MGIKYFFSWLKKSFHSQIKTININTNIKDDYKIDIDNFLVDMNGIFHYCCLKVYKYGSFKENRLLPIKKTYSFQKQKELFINSKKRRMQQWTFNSTLKNLIHKAKLNLNETQLNTIGIHNLRHSIATHLLQNGMKLEQVQKFLGHSHIESTEIYTHITQNQINSLYDNTS